MPIRVDGASSWMVLMRRSIQRAIQTLTTTKTVTVAIAFSTDQIVIRVLPSVSPIESSCGDHRVEPAEHFGRDQRPDDQRGAQLPGLDGPALAEREPAAGTSRGGSARGARAASPPSRTTAAARRPRRTARARGSARPTRYGATTAKASATMPPAWPFVRPRYQRRPQSTPAVTRIAVAAITGNCGLPTKALTAASSAAARSIMR